MIEEYLFNRCFYPLAQYITFKDIVVSLSDGCVKYIINLRHCNIEIVYYIIDEFYQIKIQTTINTDGIIFLTKSKKFKKDIKKILKRHLMKRKNFEDHILAFCLLLKDLLDNSECLYSSIEQYKMDLKFDGLFL